MTKDKPTVQDNTIGLIITKQELAYFESQVGGALTYEKNKYNNKIAEIREETIEMCIEELRPVMKNMGNMIKVFNNKAEKLRKSIGG